MPDQDQNFWLIRDLSNVIRGPFKHQEVLNLIKKKQLKNKTEISRANSYWFAVEEKTELARFFPELGLAAPPAEEAPTQMTATLTHGEAGGEREDITQFVSAEKALQEEAAPPTTVAPKGEWLSEEMAEEFGDFGDFSLVTDTNVQKEPENPPPAEEPPPERPAANTELEAEPEKPSLPMSDAPPSQDEMPTYDGKAAEEMLKRATVKADTLPSELKSFSGSRPKPINTLIKGPERTQSASNVVQVPVEKTEGAPFILSVEAEEAAAAKRKQQLVTLMMVAALGALAFLGYYFASRKTAAPVKAKAPVTASTRPAGLSAEDALKRALLLYDLEGAKEALSELELAPEMKGKTLLPVAQAMVKREFLFDSEAALGTLQLARSLASDGHARNEIDNLYAIYAFDRDPEGSVETLKRVVAADGSDPVYRYNLALGMLRLNKPQEAAPHLSALMQMVRDSSPLYADAAFAQGWAQELDPAQRDSSDASFLKAIAADPASSKARLGLAIHRLRRSGFRSSENDFRAFVDSMPDLDPPSRVINYRQMQSFDFYNSARTWIRELNLDGPMGSKPAPLVMAVDAMLSCLQNRTGEAGKIVEGALSAANGDYSVLKVMGYHRWKDGRFAEIVELFKDVPRDKQGFGVPFLLSKAMIRLDRRPQAIKLLEGLTVSNPSRSEGWSLLGDLLERDGRKKEAQIKMTNALRKDPFDLVAVRGLDRIGQSGIFSDDIMENLPF